MKDYQSLALGSVLGCAVGAYMTFNLFSEENVHSDNIELERLLLPSNQNGSEKVEKKTKEVLKESKGSLDLRRKAYISRGGCFDLCGHVVIHGNADFDLNKTIFASIDDQVARRFLRDRVGVSFFWTEQAHERINTAFLRVPKAPNHDKALIEFMETKCDFNAEHADGSFWDHLRFCYEYSAAHMKDKSPRVLLLHSIMGVGTNMFPMTKDRIPELRSLLTEFEFDQIAMFPTVLRLMSSGEMMDELLELAKFNPAKLDKLKKVVCYRVIDNERIEMDAEAFWTQLNFQAMHLLDFLPLASWKANKEDGFLRNFSLIYDLLTKANKLMCKIDFEINEAESCRAGQHKTLATEVFKLIPPKYIWKLQRKNIKLMSRKINHSLSYELHFE
uniref:Uncharacterized protein n=1 Tax=Aplanochytrium stocchinoi TaxID=215587 RepID=A0A7S3LTZ7_9STRA|mmetsp:Transcript_32290/g.39732  ORF Transcript_32290/g.39732 Transcript_32290/m.39732 type:complete len:388 (+) Transcript_32290:250-1413(+)|eukprot:CAMPEP_0204841276 /NCGR_PEP_ID=MMETSP1346-20131115/41354_1 /ASSEMBLY_ACC=CAM_ASM_000771 /TAXON_ID=215587 /ORGANISM="Aplanochytrium stocchinoi, Strain GSBS06" /LENGTH=387 /DNA_ID=CAMNT_0051979301 /DNA_START=144 /DNA_END=1307 /DNA_ORIENTATION=+